MSALSQPSCSVRHYAGDYEAHAHAHAQVLMGLDGCLQLEVAGRPAFVDASCGIVIPAGVAHAYMAKAGARMFVIDAPADVPAVLLDALGLDRVRRFAAPPQRPAQAGWHDAFTALEAIAQAPRVLARRRLDLAPLDAALDAALHEPWTTPRMAALCFLSPQRFHARLQELTGLTPQALLRQRRLDRAASLLRSGLSLDATAWQVGYRSASALAFALRRERGVGARALRGG